MNRCGRWLFRAFMTVALSLPAVTGAAEPPVPATDPAPAPSKAQLEFFETKVRPILAGTCRKCHGADKQKGGLRLDSRVAILSGGDSGPALVAGKPDESLLIEAINYKGLEMPPTGKLGDRDIAAFTEWVRMGAAWPADEPAGTVRKEGFSITEDDRRHWAFQPVGHPQVPTVRHAEQAANPIDNFLIARLEGKQLAPNPQADKRTLIRRLYYSLIGLPPAAEDVAAFAAEDSPTAYNQLVDRLLASPHYGERWGRHWLDLVRFAQTNGYERDAEKPEAWRYRDYVVRAFNADTPYDRFVLEQLAGDELDDVSRDSILATGIYRLGVWDDEPDDRLTGEYDELDEILKTAGSAFLGLTIGCARCHDHKFDPIPQEDYYRLLAFVRNVDLYGTPKSDTHYTENEQGIFTPLPTRAQLAEWKAKQAELQAQLGQLQEQIAAIDKQPDAAAADRKKQLEKGIHAVREALKKPPFDVALSVHEPETPRKPTHILTRGNAATPGKLVEPGLPRIFVGERATVPATIAWDRGGEFRGILSELGRHRTPGLRRAFAEWIAGRDNPLAARVFVNRLWQHHFGRAIVASADNFGRAGDPPTHPELLDWLAREFIDSGYQVKHLQRLIVTSSAYRLSSRADNAAAAAVDPANELLWRQNLRRLDAEAIRDSLLAASGHLNTTMGGRGIFPALSQDVLATQSRPGNGWEASSETERSRRSIYIYIKRTLMVPMLEAFDYTNTAESLGVRPVTTVAPQSLMLLNSEFVDEQSTALAGRVVREAGTADQDRIVRAFHIVLGRAPTDDETRIGRELLVHQAERFRGGAQSVAGPGGSKGGEQNVAASHEAAPHENVDERSRQKALASFCLVLLNLNEFVYVD